MSKNVKKRNITLSLVLAILLIASLAFAISQFLLVEKYKNEDAVPVSELQEVEEELSAVSQLLEIDKTWIEGNNVDATLKKYNEFKSKYPDVFPEWVNSRISRLKDLRDSSKDDELTQVNLRTQLRQANEKLSNMVQEKDSLRLVVSKASQQFKRKSDSLFKIVTQQDLQLKRKENVKVISFRNENKNLIHYIGEIQNEMANGSGIGIWNTGSVYRGQWTDNKRNGEGEFVWDDGAKYEGEFIMGERSGKGTFFYSSGEKYVGEFKKGVRDGHGILYDRDGNVSFEGKWKNDKPQ